MNGAEWQEIVERIATSCAGVGLDLVHAFNVRDYNSVAREAERLPGGQSLGILVGNTRALWPVFTRAVAADPALANAEHPLDSYVTRALTELVAAATPRPAQLIFSHVTTPTAFPIQRLAEIVEFAAVSPSHLAIHPLHGPWLSLRAVVVIDVAGPAEKTPGVERPCHGCSAPCVVALDRAVAASGAPLTAASVKAHAAEWIAVRDACPVGTGSRYGGAQLRYHYAPSGSRPISER